MSGEALEVTFAEVGPVEDWRSPRDRAVLELARRGKTHEVTAGRWVAGGVVESGAAIRLRSAWWVLSAEARAALGDPPPLPSSGEHASRPSCAPPRHASGVRTPAGSSPLSVPSRRPTP